MLLMTVGSKQKHQFVSGINVLPMVYFLFVILVIYLICMPIGCCCNGVWLPVISSRIIGAKIQPLPSKAISSEFSPFPVVSLDIRQHITLDGQSVSPEELSARLKRMLSERPSTLRAVYFNASRELPYGKVAQVMDILKEAGASPVTIQIDSSGE